eukprot:5378218-Pyramimonas_sp.AAC.1
MWRRRERSEEQEGMKEKEEEEELEVSCHPPSPFPQEARTASSPCASARAILIPNVLVHGPGR